MIKLLRIHWEFITRPSKVLEEYIPVWPISLGFGVWAILSLSSLTDSNWTRFQVDLLSYLFNGAGLFGYYMLCLVGLGLGFVGLWYVYPVVVRWVAGIKREDFDPNPYRRLILYGPLAVVVINVLGFFPLRICSGTIASFGGMNSTTVVLVMLGLHGLLGIWGLVAVIMWFVIHWKGLARYYGMNRLQIFVVMFVIPLGNLLLLMILLFPRIWEFTINYGSY